MDQMGAPAKIGGSVTTPVNDDTRASTAQSAWTAAKSLVRSAGSCMLLLAGTWADRETRYDIGISNGVKNRDDPEIARSGEQETEEQTDDED